MNEAKSLPSWKSQLKSHCYQYGDGGDDSDSGSWDVTVLVAKMPTSILLVWLLNGFIGDEHHCSLKQRH